MTLSNRPTRPIVRVAIITGAAGGLGWALTQRLWQQGYSLVLVDINADLLAQRARELNQPERAITVAMDITDTVQQQQLIDTVMTRFGRIDTLVNNAGITHRSLAEHTQLSVLRKVMAVDYQAPVELALACLPALKASAGKIVNISSMAGWMPVLGRAGYCAAKSALHQFFETLRCEIRADGVTLLMVYPSFLDTTIEQNALGFDGEPARHARTMMGAMRSADWMAGLIISAMQNGRERLFPDRLTWFASLLYKLAPAFFLERMTQKFAVELQQKKPTVEPTPSNKANPSR